MPPQGRRPGMKWQPLLTTWKHLVSLPTHEKEAECTEQSERGFMSADEIPPPARLVVSSHQSSDSTGFC